jgi:hypothetical protein
VAPVPGGKSRRPSPGSWGTACEEGYDWGAVDWLEGVGVVTRHNGIVERISDVERIAPERAVEVPGLPEQVLEVRFAGGQAGFIDMRDRRGAVWADVLRSLREQDQPAYVEIAPDTGLITELLLPLRFTVGSIESTEVGLEIELVVSHARHRLRRSNPDFDELRESLEAARESGEPMLVTETDDHEIVDVRRADETAAGSG